MASDYRAGDICEVWSNTAGGWIANARVEEAPLEDCTLDGYAVQAGAIKVAYDVGRGIQNSKWITPDQVEKVLRRPATGYPTAGGLAPPEAADAVAVGATAAPEPPASPSGRALCKHGCGRPVQPGLTKGMNAYDTCCKKCAMHRGAGEHDSNCGQTQAKMVVGRRGSLERAPGERNPRQWIVAMVAKPEEFERHVKGMWWLAFGGKRAAPVSRAWEKIEEQLMKPIGEKLALSGDERHDHLQALQKLDSSRAEGDKTGGPAPEHAGSDSIDEEGFQALCQLVLKDRSRRWFPPKLPTETRNFVIKSPLRVEDMYEFAEQVGKGSFGVVFNVSHKISRERRVCKKILKLKGQEGMKVEDILREIESMAALDHPNVIKVYQYFEDEDSIYQIMEPCMGGELQDQIDAVHRHRTAQMYTEAFMNDVIKQTLRALAFMHSERRLHKDLKPQNILLMDKLGENADSCSIKVIDFGLTELFKPDQQASSEFGGTLLYIAPEVFTLSATFKSDIWSVGVILYNLVTGNFPFIAQWPLPPGRSIDWWQGETSRLIQDPSQEAKRHANLAKVSPQLQDLIQQMFQKDANKRPDAAAALEHPWFKKFSSAPPPLSIGVIQCLEAYSWCPELKKSLFLLIAHQSTAPALQELRAIFTQFDELNKGALDLDNFREVLLGSGLTPLNVDRILYALDRDNSNSLQWTEFLAAALCIKVHRSRPLVHAAFSVVDRQMSGKVTLNDLLAIFAREGGGHEDAWKAAIAQECERISRNAETFTKDNFEKYIGEPMRTTPGDKLRLVT